MNVKQTGTARSSGSEVTRPNRIAGVGSILIGILNIVLVIYIVAATGDQRYDTGTFFVAFSQSRLSLSLAWIVFVLTASLSVTVLPEVYNRNKLASDQFAKPVALFGLIGFTVLGVWAATLLGRVPGLADQYVAGDAAVRATLVAQGLPEIDPYGWYSFFAVGTWLTLSSIQAWKSGWMHPVHAIIGILLGFSHYSTFIGGMLESEPLNLIASAGGALFYPVFFIWLGLKFIAPPKRGARPVD
jgi:hypothetical protein